jgi:hypothetical protein
MPTRNFVNTLPSFGGAGGGEYRYGMNTQEKSPELQAFHTTALYWEYDSRIGRRWNVDPVVVVSVSVYACFYNNPIAFSDDNGADPGKRAREYIQKKGLDNVSIEGGKNNSVWIMYGNKETGAAMAKVFRENLVEKIDRWIGKFFYIKAEASGSVGAAFEITGQKDFVIKGHKCNATVTGRLNLASAQVFKASFDTQKQTCDIDYIGKNGVSKISQGVELYIGVREKMTSKFADNYLLGQGDRRDILGLYAGYTTEFEGHDGYSETIKPWGGSITPAFLKYDAFKQETLWENVNPTTGNSTKLQMRPLSFKAELYGKSVRVGYGFNFFGIVKTGGSVQIGLK